MTATVIVFSNPPLPGKTKTRMIPALGEQGAADLARAMLLDTVEMVCALPWTRPVLAASAPMPADLGLPAGLEQWTQGEGDLGQRMERALARAVAGGEPALLIGSDLPGLPPKRLEQARQALERADATLGFAEDGGFYLIGLARAFSPGLLEALPWSSPDTFAATDRRLERRGLSVEHIAMWMDVDEPGDLAQVERALAGDEPLQAPHLAGWFRARSS